MSEIRQATFTTDKLDVYIDKINIDDDYFNGKYTVEVYNEAEGSREMSDRLIFDNFEEAFNHVFKAVLRLKIQNNP